MNKVNWVYVLVGGLVALVVFALGIGVLWALLSGGWGTMGSGMMGPGRTGGGLLGGILWLTLACLLPAILLTLFIVGGLWVARNVSGTRVPQQSAVECPSCGRSVEPEWQVCAYCGEELQRE